MCWVRRSFSMDLTQGIVRILTPAGETAGTGFVISDEGLVATCSHVVQTVESQERGDSRPDHVDVVFHATGECRQANVVPEWWRPYHEDEDLAILRLDGDLPNKVEVLPLGSSMGSEGNSFKTFGFTDPNPEEGLIGTGENLGEISVQGIRVLQLNSNLVDIGMSGAPVLDLAKDVIIGMITTIYDTNEAAARFRDLNLATPSETLHQLDPTTIPLRDSRFTQISASLAKHSSIEESVLLAAQQQLEAMPTDIVPSPASLPPGSRMPLSHNPLFIGREEELRSLAEVFKQDETAPGGQTKTAVITGLGGMGKTQLASEFVHRYGRHFAGGVFWFSFANPDAIPDEIASCGELGHLNLRSDYGELPLNDQVQLVKAAFKAPLPRLLVFDNCEYPELLTRWRPPTGGAKVLVTARYAEWDPALGVELLPLEKLGCQKSVTLLLNHRPDLSDDNALLAEIAEELGQLPLALHLAGKYLAHYRHIVELPTYLEQLRRAPLKHPSLSARGFSPTGHKGSLGRTFELTYDRLNSDDPVDRIALAVLMRAVFFAPGEAIPRDLLRATMGSGRDQSTEIQVEDAIIRLVSLGLLASEVDGSLRIHRLLAMFVREAGGRDQLAMNEAQAMVERTLLERTLSLNEAGNPVPLRAWQPHLRWVTDAALTRRDKRSADLCNGLASHLRRIGDYPTAQRYYKRALDIRQDLFGERHADTAESFNSLGVLFKSLGEFTLAQDYYERALSIRREVLGDRHQLTARTLNNLGALFRAKGELEEARAYYEEALSIRRDVLGEDHLDTARSFNSLGWLLKDLGMLEEARPYFERALSIRRRALGERHPLTAQSLNSLGVLLKNLGEYDKAQELYERALAIREELLGENHPDTARSLSNLGVLFRVQKRFEKAEEYHERAWSICLQVFGEHNIHTATRLNSLGVLYSKMGKSGKSRECYEQAISIRREMLGDSHLDTALSLNNMAALLRKTGELEEAQRYYEQALSIRQKVRGNDHLDTAKSLYGLGLVHRDQRNPGEARTYFQRALAIYEDMLGPDHSRTKIVSTTTRL